MGQGVNIRPPPIGVNLRDDTRSAVVGRLDVSVPLPIYRGRGSPSYGAGEPTRTLAPRNSFLNYLWVTVP